MPKVSILLPTYRHAPWLMRAIQSVQDQSFLDWELIIIDDGLADPVKLALRGFIHGNQKITVLKNHGNQGIQKSLNHGLRTARGTYIARIDDDDIWIDRLKLERQVEYLDEHPACVLVGTNAIICDEQGQSLGSYGLPQDDEAIRARMLSRNCFLHPSIMMRKSTVDQTGGYDECVQVRHVEDYALWLRLGLLGTFFNVAEPMVQLMIRADSMTYQNRIIQAKRTFALAYHHRRDYPNFFLGAVVLITRIVGFSVISIIPIPKKLLYTIQKIYKKI